MVAINGRAAIRHAVDILCTQYNNCITLFYGQPAALSPSSSFVDPNLSEPVHTLAPPPSKDAPNGRVSKYRKQGRVKRKRYNELARDNSTVFLPGGFAKQTEESPSNDADHNLQDDCEPIDCDPKPADETQERREPQSNPEAANDNGASVKKGSESHKSRRESEFKVKTIAERMKGMTAERRALVEWDRMRSERLWKMMELERQEEKDGANRWKDQRLAQLEKEKQAAENELAREKIERKHSKLQRVFKVQEQRQRDEERWKRLRERDAKLAAEREGRLRRENAMLQDNIRATDDALQKACSERDHIRQEKEEERARRLRAEEDLRRWKELMEEYFPGGQQEQDQGQQQESQQEPPSLEAQFELYEKKWEILRSGIDIDGTEIHLIHFSQIPWPVVNMTATDPSQIQPEHIREFLTHRLREKLDASGRRNGRLIAKDELMRWHSDKFDRAVLSKVREEDKQAASEAAGMVARVLTDMLK